MKILFIKMLIILLFIVSILLWIFFTLALIVYRPDMSILQNDNCRSLGAYWDTELKMCNWF
jgi:hypothetical protein